MTDECTVYVRGFDFTTTEEQLGQHCAQVGDVMAITFQGKGAAQVTYNTPEEALSAVENLDRSTIEGNQRYIEVKIDGSSGNINPTGAMKQKGANTPAQRRSLPPPSVPVDKACKVFVWGFDYGTTGEALIEHCQQVGEVVQISFQQKNAVIVGFRFEHEAQAAVEQLNGTILEGGTREIQVKHNQDKRERHLAAKDQDVPPLKKQKVDRQLATANQKWKAAAVAQAKNRLMSHTPEPEEDWGGEEDWTAYAAETWRLFCEATPASLRSMERFLSGFPPVAKATLKMNSEGGLGKGKAKGGSLKGYAYGS